MLPDELMANWPPAKQRLLREILEYGLSPVACPPRVESLAATLHVSARALAKRLQHAGLPKVHILLTWCMAWRAVHCLLQSNHSLSAIAWGLGLSSAYSIRRILRRFLAEAPRTIRRTWTIAEAETILDLTLIDLLGGEAPA